MRSSPDGYKANVVKKAKSRAKCTGLSFDLDWRRMHWPERCPMLGIPLVYGRTGNKQNREDSPSLDRIDPTKGYTLDNVHVISMRANRIKNNARPDELRAIADYMDVFYGL